MRNCFQILASRIGTLALTVLLGGLLTAVMVRVSPGFLVDERELDPRLNQASRRAIQQEHAANANVLSFFAGRLKRIALHGDLGDSPSLNRPISQLLRERLPVTLQLIVIGVAGGWALAFALALPAVMCRSRWFRGMAGSLQQILLCLPAAALAWIEPDAPEDV